MTPPAHFACRFAFTPDSSAVTISLAGKLDPEAVEELHPQVQEVYRAGVRRFVFELSKLEYAGSLGLRLLLGLQQQVKQDGRVVLCNPSEAVESVLDMMKLKEVLPVYRACEEALEATKK